jgi:hypothetical protein
VDSDFLDARRMRREFGEAVGEGWEKKNESTVSTASKKTHQTGAEEY